VHQALDALLDLDEQPKSVMLVTVPRTTVPTG
jgi:hypothetical protein